MSTGKVKLLEKDRKTFERFCKFTKVEDVDLIFDSAAAKEVPIDFDELVANAKLLQSSSKALSVLEEFALLVFDGEPVGSLDINNLRDRWIRRQESSGSSGEIEIAVHEKIRQQAILIEELESQLKNNSRIIVNYQDRSSQTDALTTKSIKPAYSQTDKVEILKSPVISATNFNDLERQIKDLESKLKRSESEATALRDSKSVVESRLHALEREKNRFSFLERLAERQAERDAEVSVLKSEIEELKTSRPPSPVPQPSNDNRDELKRNIFVKFASYAISNDYDKMKSLIPVATELFQLTNQDVEALSRACTTDTTWLSSYLRI